MASEYVPLWTLADAVEYLIDQGSATGTAEERRKARRCVMDCYREFPNRDSWLYFERKGAISTQASQDDGTITYDHCVTPEHEALTRSGWKRHDQLRIGEEILAYDHETETTSWQPIEKIHRFDYDGKILDVRRKGRSVLRCTPNHRIPFFKRFGGRNTRLEGRYTKGFVRAEDLTEEHLVPLAAPLNVESDGPLDSRRAALMGWCVTDGSGTFDHGRSAMIHQSHVANPEKCAEIGVLTRRSPWRGGTGKFCFGLLKEDRDALRAAGRSKDDLVPLFCRFGVQEASAAARAMSLAESSTNSNGQKVFSQWGNNKPVAEAFQIASILSGVATNISEREFGGKVRYQCPVRTKNRIKLKRQSEWVNYRGVVWCPQVRTSAWVMRCNGAVMITGNSGGAYERLVTLSGATVPDNGAWFTLKIGTVEYEVERVIDTTRFTLAEFSNPGEDLAAGTSYILYRTIYPVPIDWRRGTTPIGVGDWLTPVYIPPGELMQAKRLNAYPQGWQRWYTIRGGGQQYSGMVFEFQPPPNGEHTWQYLYQADPRPIGLIGTATEYSTGTVSVSGTTVTGVGTTFSARMIGSVIRFTESTTVVPTGSGGKVGSGADNPYTEQRIVSDVSTTTSLTIDDSLTGTYSAVKFSIGDPLDLDYHVMLDAFLAMCVWKWAQMQRYDQDVIDAKEADWLRTFKRARASDYRTPDVEPPVPTPLYARLLP